MNVASRRAAGQPPIYVVATGEGGTCAALTVAVRLARRAASPLVVLVPHVVSYTSPIEDLADAGVCAANRYRDFVRDLGAEARIRLCLCRRPDDTLGLLPPGSTVVIGETARRWLPGSERRLARRLRLAGHAVLFAAAEDPIPTRANRATLVPGRS
jgi:hypothetical protein